MMIFKCSRTEAKCMMLRVVHRNSTIKLNFWDSNVTDLNDNIFDKIMASQELEHELYENLCLGCLDEVSVESGGVFRASNFIQLYVPNLDSQ